jgi:uncharacterized membrane protein
MKHDWRLAAILVLAILGVAFSTYLTYYTFSSGQSACELRILGLPSCFYGLVVYLLIALPSLSVMLANRNLKSEALFSLSLIGIIFSASLTVYIFGLGESCVNLNIFGAPPCVLGLIMYTLVLLIGLDLFLKSGRTKPA